MVRDLKKISASCGRCHATVTWVRDAVKMPARAVTTSLQSISRTTGSAADCAAAESGSSCARRSTPVLAKVDVGCPRRGEACEARDHFLRLDRPRRCPPTQYEVP